MARPHPVLVHLAAGRDAGPIPDDESLLASALDHGMQGLLWSRVRDEAPARPWATTLAGADLVVRRRHATLWAALAESTARLAERGIAVATVKGVTAEARWYAREGERPCHDVDLLVEPGGVERAAEVLDALQPGHPLRADIDGLVASGALPSVNVHVDGVAVDVHFDLFKLGVAPRCRDAVWEHTTTVAVPGGGTCTVLDDELSLVHFLLHLNKDSFAWLLGYADIARVVASADLDWDAVDGFVRSEGVEVLAYRSLETVAGRLGLALPTPAQRGARARVWRAVWPERATLLGSAGTNRSRRQDVIPFLVRGRFADALVGTVRSLVPPKAAVDVRYPELRGPYAWRLARGRLATMRGRRQAFRARRAPLPPPRGSVGLDAATTARLLRSAAANEPLWLDVSGRSMGWSIPAGARVRIQPGGVPRRGEVWAFCDGGGRVVVHRCRGSTDGGHRFQGDACVRDDGAVAEDRLVGRVVEVGPGTSRLRWSPLAGAVQRVPRAGAAAVHRWMRSRHLR